MVGFRAAGGPRFAPTGHAEDLTCQAFAFADCASPDPIPSHRFLLHPGMRNLPLFKDVRSPGRRQQFQNAGPGTDLIAGAFGCA